MQHKDRLFIASLVAVLCCCVLVSFQSFTIGRSESRLALVGTEDVGTSKYHVRHLISQTKPDSSSKHSFHHATSKHGVYDNEWSGKIGRSPKWTIHWTSDIDKRAKCLDGSSGAFYVSLASSDSPNSDKWLIAHNWGGWCSLDVPIDWKEDPTVDHCYHRSVKATGSSKGLKSTDSVAEQYYQKRDPILNPTFHDWNYVFVPYCDGTSFSGRRRHSILLDGPYGQRRIYFRGGYIRDAIAAMLLPMGLVDATVLVVAGASAGGLATLMHADWWADSVVPQADVLGIVDSGYFPACTADNSSNVEVAPFVYRSNVTEYPIQSFADQMRFLHRRAHAEVHRACAWALGPADEWRCMLGAVLAHYVETPIMLLGSVYDSWHLKNLLGYTSDVDRVNAFGRRMRDEMIAFAAADGGAAGRAAFLNGCMQHVGPWLGAVGGGGAGGAGTDMRGAVDTWVTWQLGGRRRAGGADPLPGYMLWVENRSFPCPACCRGLPPPRGR